MMKAIQCGHFDNLELTCCQYCDTHFITDYVSEHYHSLYHRNVLEEQFDNLFSITEDGVPILLE